MKAVDLFCGCGGLSLGLQESGINILAAYDNWAPAVFTYEQNLSHPVFRIDLSERSNIEAIKSLSPDLIAGGPPCQDFSSAGKRDEDNGRGDLTVAFAKVIVEVKPKFFIMENVERILKTRKLVEFKGIIEAAGYTYFQDVLDASKFNVPQLRKRYFMVGGIDFNPAAFKFRLGLLSSSTSLTVRQYFGSNLDIDYYYRHPRSYARRAIFSVDEPSPTIRGVNRPIPKGYPGHPGDPIAIGESKFLRPLTTRERARIQTFPDNFVFYGSKADQEQMIGNAVPVNLAKAVGDALMIYIEKETLLSNPSDSELLYN